MTIQILIKPDLKTMITLTGIAIKQASRSPMQETDSATITREKGLTGDFRGKPGNRQVTVLSHESWQQACSELNTELPWTTRRANLLLTGIRFNPEDVGKALLIGDVRLEITRETDPCKRMDEARQGLKNILTPDWRGGVCCRVISGGQVSAGDVVTLK